MPSGSGRSRTIVEPAREIPVREDVDVLVAGGGLAGVSAAVAAARAGARTLLVERNGFPGGVATAGMCCSIFNCLYTPSRELVVRGNALEFVERLARCGGPGAAWRDHKGHIIYDLERGKLALTELLEESGARYLLDTLACAAVVEDGRLHGAVVESKSGREALLAKVTVDATGDADVAALAGAPLRTVEELGWAKHSYCFRVGTVDVDRFVQYFADNPGQYPPYMDVDWDFEEARRQYDATGTFLFPHGGGFQMELIMQGAARGEYPARVGVHSSDVPALQMHAIRDLGVVHIITGFCEIHDLDVGETTQAISDGRRMAFQVTDYFTKHVPGFERACVIGAADDLGLRASRWIEGELDFTPEMKSQGAQFADAIGRGVIQRDFRKHPGEKAWG
ncbi:MAG: FAD-dependent oxidoreductase, partial [Armatimonadetes bacterium]|nr:FAD-dependent oxidoreductase [Armatimonadota bacterium]